MEILLLQLKHQPAAQEFSSIRKRLFESVFCTTIECCHSCLRALNGPAFDVTGSMIHLKEQPAPIHSIPLSERPRERCLDTGPSCLSLRECLALVLGSGPPGIGCLGLATRILNRPGIGLSSSEEEAAFFTAMEISGPGYLKELSGLGPAGQAKLLAAFELGRRYALFRDQAAQRLRKPASAPQLARRALRTVSQNQKNSPQEWLGFVPVYRSGHLGELCLVEKGVRTHVNIDPAELFARILALRPIGFFLFHNHPSGNPSPSSQDLDLTERIADISKQFGIQLLGHWVVSSQNERWIYPPHSDKEE